ncbi:hypothetical protein GCM10018789_54390 [Streptomyces werraensis]|nr:hypothetical protein GCM10018789_54390 [Streptomyces werraensis]
MGRVRRAVRFVAYARLTAAPDRVGQGLNVIVFPELLGDLLEQVDQKRGAHLALDFAGHVLDIERDGIAEPVRAV